ncbi:MAG: ABC transporter permease, partial [Anaerolineae bacterium]|nr:ABC transporter permease [Anaerolineae bacterium]
MNLRLGASLVESSGKSVTRRLRPISAILRNRKAAFGAAVLLIFVLIALLAPLLAPGDPNQFVGRPRQAPSAAFPLGTTGQGQDVLKQMIWGTRTSVTIGIIAGLATTALGVGIGMAAGYFGGFADELISLVINIFLVVPGLPLLVTLAAFLPSGPGTIVFVLAFTGWAWPARVLRSLTLSLREKDFVFAAVVAGESSARIILVEILPNMMSIVAATFFNAVIYAIVAEAGLEFLG